MKRIITILAFAFASLIAFSQDIPAGMRMEISEAGSDSNKYSVFSYKDNDGSAGYYLGIARESKIVETFLDDEFFSSLDRIDETCIYLGADAGEAYAAMESILELYDADAGTVKEFAARESNGARLGKEAVATFIVRKKFLGGKKIQVVFNSGSHTVDADLTKSGLKSLMWGFKLTQKI